MNLLVTGGAGFIGSNFIHYWIKNHPGDKVVNYDKLTYAGNIESLRDIEENPNYEFVKGDILDRKLLDKTLKNSSIDTIVHFAAESHVDRSIDNPPIFVETNVVGTQVLLDAAKDNGNIRFHNISTDEVFGSLPLNSEEKFTEETPYDPRNPYSASKAAADHLVRAYHETYGLPITISNCSNNYGPYQFPEKFIPLSITRALFNEKIPLYGDGLNVRDWIHTEDHCYGIDLILQKGKIGETYLLGGNGEESNINLIRKILKLMDASESLIARVGDRKGHDRRYAIDFTKTKNKLGFRPKYTLDEGLVQTVEWYKANGIWWKELKKDADVIAGKYLANPLN